MILTPEDLGYHRVSSMQAAAGAEPQALNHLGIETRPASGRGHLVTAALEGYPAHAAGIERGDVILTLDGDAFQPVLSLNPDARGGRFRPQHTSVEVTVRRGGASDAETRRAILEPVFESLHDSYRTATANSLLRFAAGNKVIGYLRLWALTRATDDLITLRRLVGSLRDTDGIVLDLRNSQGYLDAEHIDLFRASRSDFLAIEGTPEDRARLIGTQLSRAESLRAYRRPIAILVDGSTQGAGELLAYQLGKLERITTVGTATPGRLGSYSAESLAEAGRLLYVAPQGLRIDGRAFEGIGLSPEREVAFPYEQVTRSDPQFQAAVTLLLGVI